MEVFLSALPQLVEGVPTTLGLLGASLLIGFLLAVAIAAVRMARIPVISHIAFGFVFFFRGTPLLVQIFLIYYGLSQFEAVRESIFWPVLREPFWSAVTAYALNTAAYTSEIIRGGILAVPAGQIEAARAAGMTPSQGFLRITLPAGLRHALPAYSNEVILMMHGTALASTITLFDITGVASDIAAQTNAYVPAFCAAAVFYLVLTFSIVGLFRLAEARLTPHLKSHSDLARA